MPSLRCGLYHATSLAAPSLPGSTRSNATAESSSCGRMPDTCRATHADASGTQPAARLSSPPAAAAPEAPPPDDAAGEWACGSGGRVRAWEEDSS